MFKNNCTFFFVFILSLAGFQNLYAQENDFIDKELVKQLRGIRHEFDENMKPYDYKTDPDLYGKKFSFFYSEKITKLNNLYNRLYDQDTVSEGLAVDIKGFGTNQNPEIIEKIDESVPPAIMIQSDSPKFQVIEDYRQVENIQQVLAFRKRFSENFPNVNDLSEDDTYCDLNFVLDTDGKIKKIKYKGGREFCLISAIHMYSLRNQGKPLQFQGKPIKIYLKQPIRLKVE
ncbi:hypothetical protein [Chryseobacterium sp. H1D6B]|uniref:hypothetical protein n=1 Tax=Chryseobacterium sp. H1D6B TaxID=2940588 RepID=UPI0015CD1F4A|nr:hypothetical protein [Chryseobacterium sp. H1D6B]